MTTLAKASEQSQIIDPETGEIVDGSNGNKNDGMPPSPPSRSQLEFLASLYKRAGVKDATDMDVDLHDRAAVSRKIERLRNEQPVDDPIAFVNARLAR